MWPCECYIKLDLENKKRTYPLWNIWSDSESFLFLAAELPLPTANRPAPTFSYVIKTRQHTLHENHHDLSCSSILQYSVYHVCIKQFKRKLSALLWNKREMLRCSLVICGRGAAKRVSNVQPAAMLACSDIITPSFTIFTSAGHYSSWRKQ